MIAMIGSIIVLASVVIGFLMAGGDLLLLWHPSEIVVIIGAALGAFVTSHPLKVVKASFANAVGLFKAPAYTRDSYVDLLKLVFDLLVKAPWWQPLVEAGEPDRRFDFDGTCRFVDRKLD